MNAYNNLFMMVQTCKQPRCPLLGEWIHKLWKIQAVEYESVIERNKLSMKGCGENLNLYY